MSYPHFIAIDGSSWEDQAHPVAIAWSMADGQIKTTLIQPEDGWDEWDISLQDLHGIGPDTLFQLGETVWSVIRELENDLEQPHLYADEEGRANQLLEKLYDACGRDLSFDVSHCRDVLSDGIPEPEQLNYMPCDERVHQMLLAWAADHEAG